MVCQERILQSYLDMIKINSVTGSERHIAEYIAGKLNNMGLEVKWSYYDDNKESPSIYAQLDGNCSGPTLLLIGHMDTVAVARGWSTDPFTPIVEGDKVTGLGSMDMKGGISAILETLQVFIEEKASLAGKIIAAFVSDEEAFSRGTYQLLKDGLSADMAIMAECRFNEVAVSFRGRYSIAVTVYGKTAHASKYPYVGENAVINASKMAIGIEKLSTKTHAELGEGTWCIRHISGGIKNTLSVPDKCELFVDRYVVPGETYEMCKEQIMDLADEIGLGDKVSVEPVARTTPYMEAFSLNKDHPLVTTLQDNFKKVTGKELTLGYDKSVCDSNYLVTIGNIPTVTFGPSGDNMHGANECGYISQINAATEIYIETIKALLCKK